MRPYKLKKCPRVHGLHFAPDGSRLLAAGGAEAGMFDSAVWLDLATGETTGRIEQFARAYAVSPDLSKLVLLGAHRYRGGHSALQWTPLPNFDGGWHRLPGSSGRRTTIASASEVWGIAFTPSGERFVVGYGDAHRRTADLGVYEWEMGIAVVQFATGEIVRRLSVPGLPGVFAFNADETRLAISGGPEGGGPEMTVLAFPDGAPKFVFTPPGTRTRCLMYLPDGRLVAANARNIFVLPPDGRAPRFVLEGHQGQVNALAVVPDGSRVLSASHDGSIRVWDLSDGREIAALNWEIGPVTALAFAPDGLTCAAAGARGQVIVWDADA